MSLSLSNPSWFSVSLFSKHKQPVFSSSRVVFRSVRARNARVGVKHVARTAKPKQNTYPAQPNPWYDDINLHEVFLDIFWGRRNLLGILRSKQTYRRVLCWQAAASLLLFYPLGGMLILLNICCGLRPKATRIAFLTSCVFALCLVSYATLASDPITLAALR